MDLRDDAQALGGDLSALRHDLHQEPEVGVDLPRTQEKVLSELGGLPLEIHTGNSLTSVTAVLRGGGSGPVVLLRGDMDALPLTEQVEVPFRSRTEGAMHACGHDLHTTMLVGAARLLATHREKLPGTVVFMFQPGEEGHDGAQLMIDEGVLDVAGERPVAAYALHVTSSMWPQGTFATRPGPLLAAADHLYVTVHGTGGHGSAPHKARDPVPAACEMVTALQTSLTRTIDPFDTAVLTVGSFHAGTKDNVIPEKARFEATVRTFRDETRDLVARNAPRVCQGIAAAHGLDAEVSFSGGYPVTKNSEREISFISDVVTDVFGPDRHHLMQNPLTGSEDFSRVLERVPGAMVFLGAAATGADPEKAPYNHSSYANFDDTVLPDGAALYAQLAAQRLVAPA